MISNPKHGWCDFSFGHMKDRASYTTCVPCDLLAGFIKAIENPVEGAIVYLDAEGYGYYLVLTDFSPYVIAEKGVRPRLYATKKTVKKLAAELLDDLDGMEQIYAENFATDDDTEEVEAVQHNIWQKECKLRKLLDDSK